jgi:hypothetical protein
MMACRLIMIPDVETTPRGAGSGPLQHDWAAI